MTHRTTPEFWQLYNALPPAIQKLADKNYEILKQDPWHPSLHFKEVDEGLWSVRIGIAYRALANEEEDDVFVWFWIGSHGDYDKIIG